MVNTEERKNENFIVFHCVINESFLFKTSFFYLLYLFLFFNLFFYPYDDVL